MFTNRSKVLFVASLLATLYVIYLFSYFGGTVSSTDGAEQVGSAIATALVMPHFIVTGIGAIFGWIGFITRKTWAALVGAILYSVGLLLFIVYFIFSVPLIILGFSGYSKQKEINKNC